MAAIKHIRAVAYAFFGCALSACNTTTNKNISPNISNYQAYDGIINLCRNSSFVAGVYKPDIMVNDEIVDELPSNSKVSVGANSGDKFKIFLPSNFIANRHRDETILEAGIQSGTSYLLVETKVNIGAGIAGAPAGGGIVSAAIGGAILGATGATTSILLNENKTKITSENNKSETRIALTDLQKHNPKGRYQTGHWAVRMVDKRTFLNECEVK